jgi:dUTP pyrophosphatase
LNAASDTCPPTIAEEAAVPPQLKLRRRPGTEDVPLPRYMSEHAAGLDLFAACDEPVTINPGEIKLVSTGLFVEVPIGYEGQIRARSGLALRLGLMLPNAPGTIDADYRGELQVIVGNCSKEPFTIERGMRFAQFIIAPVQQVAVVEVAELSETARAGGGFGSTGR